MFLLYPPIPPRLLSTHFTDSTSRASHEAQGHRARLPAQETQAMPVPSLGCSDPLTYKMAACFSILAWQTPWSEEPGRLQSTGLQRVEYDWATEHSATLKTMLFKHILCFSEHLGFPPFLPPSHPDFSSWFYPSLKCLLNHKEDFMVICNFKRNFMVTLGSRLSTASL